MDRFDIARLWRYKEECDRLEWKFRNSRLSREEVKRFCSVFGLTHLTGFNVGGIPTLTLITASNVHSNGFNVSNSLGNPAFPCEVIHTINSGIYIAAASVGQTSYNTGSFAAGSKFKLVNLGFIMGIGGFGAAVGGSNTGPAAGSNAMNLSIDVTIDNASGYILGGGGGGGGVWIASNSYAGGGGGAGDGNGGNSNDTFGVAFGGVNASFGAVGPDGQSALSGSIHGRSSGGSGGFVAEGSGGAGGQVIISTSSAPGRGGGCGGGGGAMCLDDDNANGGAGGNNVSDGVAGSRGTPGGVASAFAGGGGGGWGMSGGNGFRSVASGTLYNGAGPGKAINLNGLIATFLGGSSSPRVRGAVS